MEFLVSVIFSVLFVKIVGGICAHCEICINIAHANKYFESGSIDHTKIKLYNFSSSCRFTNYIVNLNRFLIIE